MVIPVIPPLLCAVHCNVQSHFWEEISPNVQPKFLLVELETIFSHPVVGCLEEEADLHLATSSCQRVQGSVEVTLESSLVQAFSNLV